MRRRDIERTLLMTVQVDDLLQRDRHGIVPVNTGREKNSQLD